MRHLHLLPALAQSHSSHEVILLNQFTLLQHSNLRTYLLQVAAAHSKHILYHLVIDCLLFHDQRILSISIIAKVPVLSGKNNAETFAILQLQKLQTIGEIITPFVSSSCLIIYQDF